MTNSIDSLWKLNAKKLIDLLDKKEISPLEILDANVNRINEVNKNINAVVTLCKERAAHNISKTGGENTILKNIPVLIKDVTDVKGVKTTFGSKFMKIIYQKDPIY